MRILLGLTVLANATTWVLYPQLCDVIAWRYR